MIPLINHDSSEGEQWGRYNLPKSYVYVLLYGNLKIHKWKSFKIMIFANFRKCYKNAAKKKTSHWTLTWQPSYTFSSLSPSIKMSTSVGLSAKKHDKPGQKQHATGFQLFSWSKSKGWVWDADPNGAQWSARQVLWKFEQLGCDSKFQKYARMPLPRIDTLILRNLRNFILPSGYDIHSLPWKITMLLIR